MIFLEGEPPEEGTFYLILAVIRPDGKISTIQVTRDAGTNLATPEMYERVFHPAMHQLMIAAFENDRMGGQDAGEIESSATAFRGSQPRGDVPKGEGDTSQHDG